MNASTSATIAQQGVAQLILFVTEFFQEMWPILLGITILFVGILWLKSLWHKRV